MVNFILRFFMAMLLFASTCTEAVSASYTQYSALAQKYDKMSSEQIMAAAEKHEEAEDNERAIVLYTIVPKDSATISLRAKSRNVSSLT